MNHVTNNPTPCVRTCDTLMAELKRLYDTRGWSWREIAQGRAGDDFKGIPPGTLNAIYHGAGVPKKWYWQLGIPPEVTVTPVNDHHIPEGTQVLVALTCIKPDCQISFVPNTTRRKKCYDCSPFRKRKKETP